jgi:hypothetical protein
MHFSYKSAAFFHLHLTREKLPKKLLYKKGARKQLMKLTPNVFLEKYYSDLRSKNKTIFFQNKVLSREQQQM